MKFQIKILDMKDIGNNGLDIIFQVRIVEKRTTLFQGAVEKQTIMRGDLLSFDLDQIVIFPGEG